MTQPFAFRMLLPRIVAATVVLSCSLHALDNPDPPPPPKVTTFELRQIGVGVQGTLDGGVVPGRLDAARSLAHRSSYVMEPDRTGQIKLELTLAHSYTGATSCVLVDDHGTRLQTFGGAGTSSFNINVGLFHPPFHLCYIGPSGYVVDQRTIVPLRAMEGEDGNGFVGASSSSGGGLEKLNLDGNPIVAGTNGAEGNNGEDGTGTCGASACSACDLTGGGDPGKHDDVRVADVDGPDSGDDGKFGMAQQAGSSANGDSRTTLDAIVDPSAGISVKDFKVHGNGDVKIARVTVGSDEVVSSVETGTAYSKVVATTVGGNSAVKISQWKTKSESDASASPYRTVVFENSAPNQITRTSTYDSKEIKTIWRFTSGTPSKWELVTGNGLRRVEVIREDDGSDLTKMEVRTKKYERAASALSTSEANVLVSEILQTYTKYSFGWKKTKLEVCGLSGNPLVSKWQYFEGNVDSGPSSKNGRGLLLSYIRPDGSGTSRTYTENTGSGTFTMTANASPLNGSDVFQEQMGSNAGGTSTSYQRTVDSVAGPVVVGSSTTTVATDNSFNISSYNGTGGIVSTNGTIHAFGSDHGGKPAAVRPDATATYGETVTYNRTGTGIADYLLTITHRTGAMASGVVYDGTQTVVTLDRNGVVDSRLVSDLASPATNVILEIATVDTFDAVGRPTKIDYFDSGSAPLWSELIAYSCCGVSSVTDRDGMVTTFEYDDLLRQTSSASRGITMQTIYDGLVVRTKRSTSAFGSHEIENVERNLARTSIISRTRSPEDGSLVETSTTTTYRNPEGPTPNPGSLPSNIGRRVVRQLPLTTDDNSTPPKETTDYFYDGRPYQTTGNLGTNVRFLYSVSSYNRANSTATKLFSTTMYRLDGTTQKESAVTWVDWMGRTVLASGFGDEGTLYFYDSSNLLVKAVDADGVIKLYKYNSRHERTTTALDLNADGVIDYGSDGVSFQETKPLNDGTRDLIRTTTKVWKPGAGFSSPTVVSYGEVTPDGLHSWTRSFPTTGSGYGVSIAVRTVGSGGDWTVATANRDGTTSTQYYDNGYLVANTLWASGSTPPTTAPSNIMSVATSGFVAGTAYGYDALGRATTTTASRTGTVTNNRHGADSGFRDEVLSVTDAGGRTTAYTYDHRGRTKSVDMPNTPNPLGGNFSNIVTTTHYPDDSVNEVAGTTYKTSYIYDYADRMASLATYRTDTEINPPTTVWTYDGNGRLQQKLYPDGPDAGTAADPGPSYTYTPGGRIKKWIWGSGKTTRYDYVAGRLYAKRYFTSATSQATIDAASTGNDSSTPDLIYTLDSLGRLTGVVRGTSPHFSYSYDDNDLGVLTETQLDAVAAPRLLTRKRDGILRSSGYQFGTPAAPGIPADPIAVSEVSYGYDTAGRFETVKYQRIPGESGHPAAQTFTYDYEYDTPGGTSHYRHTSGTAKSSLIPFGMDGPQYSVSRTYETTRSLLTGTYYTVGTDNPSAFDYSYNSLGQRQDVARSSDNYSNVENIAWKYDAKGQVTSSDSNAGTGSSDDRYYEYDGIGNRVKSRTGTATSTGGTETIYYADAGATSTGANALNQHGSIVTGSNAADPVYDPDGNLVDDGVAWDYAWDGENRMISATPKVPTSGSKIGYVYDYLGRLCTRRFFSWNAGSSSWSNSENYRYVYDGWNRIESYLDWNLLQDEYVWGLDLSGTLQGAGGVGGMLQWVTSYDDGDNWNNYYPLYDGNGNVTELLDDAGAVRGHWEYDPFGNIVRSMSPMNWYDPVNLFEFRFSTKPQDRRTGHYYYGNRFYDSVWGRWINRDPIEEQGGLNVYGMVYNDPVDSVDPHGFGLTTVDSNPTNTAQVAALIALAEDTVVGVVAAGVAEEVRPDPPAPLPRPKPRPKPDNKPKVDPKPDKKTDRPPPPPPPENCKKTCNDGEFAKYKLCPVPIHTKPYYAAKMAKEWGPHYRVTEAAERGKPNKGDKPCEGRNGAKLSETGQVCSMNVTFGYIPNPDVSDVVSETKDSVLSMKKCPCCFEGPNGPELKESWSVNHPDQGTHVDGVRKPVPPWH